MTHLIGSNVSLFAKMEAERRRENIWMCLYAMLWKNPTRSRDEPRIKNKM